MAIVKQISHVLQNRDTRLVCSHVIHDAVKRLATWVLEAFLLALCAAGKETTTGRLQVVALGDVPIDSAPLNFDMVEIGFDGLAGEVVKVAREGLCDVSTRRFRNAWQAHSCLRNHVPRGEGAGEARHLPARAPQHQNGRRALRRHLYCERARWNT